MRVVRVCDRSSRWAGIDLLLISAVQTLHPGITAVVQPLHHLAAANPANPAWAASSTVARSAAVRAKVAAVVQTALLPTDWARYATGATTAIAVAHATAGNFAQQTAAGIALLAAIVTACVVAQAPGSAGHYHRN